MLAGRAVLGLTGDADGTGHTGGWIPYVIHKCVPSSTQPNGWDLGLHCLAAECGLLVFMEQTPFW